MKNEDIRVQELDLQHICPENVAEIFPHQMKKFVYLRSTYVISVQFVGSKYDSREPRKRVYLRTTYRLCLYNRRET